MRAAILGVLLFTLPAGAQEQSIEERLREALRKQTVDLRAAQDAQAAMQAQLDQATKQRDLLQQQVSELQSTLATQPAPAAAPKPEPDVAAERAQVVALQAQVKASQEALAKWQASYQEAAGLARAKDAEARQAAAASKQAADANGACVAENGKLLDVAHDILHLYETAGFRRTITGSYEPLLGLKRVELQNIVQDYDDKIRDHQYVPPVKR